MNLALTVVCNMLFRCHPAGSQEVKKNLVVKVISIKGGMLGVVN